MVKTHNVHDDWKLEVKVEGYAPDTFFFFRFKEYMIIRNEDGTRFWITDSIPAFIREYEYIDMEEVEWARIESPEGKESYVIKK